VSELLTPRTSCAECAIAANAVSRPSLKKTRRLRPKKRGKRRGQPARGQGAPRATSRALCLPSHGLFLQVPVKPFSLSYELPKMCDLSSPREHKGDVTQVTVTVT